MINDACAHTMPISNVCLTPRVLHVWSLMSSTQIPCIAPNYQELLDVEYNVLPWEKINRSSHLGFFIVNLFLKQFLKLIQSAEKACCATPVGAAAL